MNLRDIDSLCLIIDVCVNRKCLPGILQFFKHNRGRSGQGCSLKGKGKLYFSVRTLRSELLTCRYRISAVIQDRIFRSLVNQHSR